MTVAQPVLQTGLVRPAKPFHGRWRGGPHHGRYIEGIDGDLVAILNLDIVGGTDETVLQLCNLHGDTIAAASLDPQANQLLDRFETDEYGNPRQTAGADKRYGWLGAKQRRTELASGVIQMGVRSYVPALGRFTSVDPVVGGSANAYDYAFQNPVNIYDLDGRLPVVAGPFAVFASRAFVTWAA
jgi:RHS repeat-associated protein